MTDAVVIGSGPNGLAAAVALAQAGAKVLVLEAHEQIGGGTRTAELTLPGFKHDVCSAVHPMGPLSPYLRTLPLEAHGLRWKRGTASVAHPLDEGPAALLTRSVDETAAQFSPASERAYRRLVAPFLGEMDALLADALAPLKIPRHPFLMARFGLLAIRSAQSLVRRFDDPRARALFVGCAGHAILPMDFALTGALGLMFLLTGHADDWPVAEGGSHAITQALASLLVSLGGRIETNTRVTSFAQLPEARAYLFDTDPFQLASIAEAQLPTGYVQRLRKYRFGPAAFKVDWALSGPVPWRDPACLRATTLHLGGTFEEIAASEAAMWRGEHSEKPYILYAQQSAVDSTRAPAGCHTGWAYCHVPANSTKDMTAIIEAQVERFAPGFGERILARHVSSPQFFADYNSNDVGGAITGGVADLGQLFTRPVARLNPYTTPNPRIFICSGSTPPGGGVHGMCGYFAAQAALKHALRKSIGGKRPLALPPPP